MKDVEKGDRELNHLFVFGSAMLYSCSMLGSTHTRTHARTHARTHTHTQHSSAKKLSVSLLYISFSIVFHRLICCLSVVLYFDKGDCPENVHVVFCPDKQRSFECFMCLKCFVLSCNNHRLFEPFICLDLVSES